MPTMIQAIVVDLGCLPEMEGKTLHLKIPQFGIQDLENSPSLNYSHRTKSCYVQENKQSTVLPAVEPTDHKVFGQAKCYFLTVS